VDVRSEFDERIGDVRPHEPVGSSDEHGTADEIPEVMMECLEILLAPHGFLISDHHLVPCRIQVFGFADTIEW
jgi:hypothetical protein